MPTILVADDDTDILDVVTFKLTRAGHVVVGATDGEAALELARATRPQIAVVDWMMPKRTGLEVCRAIRAEPTLADTRIVLLTARAQEADLERGFAAGVDDYLVKPFSPRDLLSRIDALAAGTVRPCSPPRSWSTSPGPGTCSSPG